MKVGKYILLFNLIAINLQAQEFKAKASFSAVPKTGFYQIAVSPELSAHCKIDLSDVRIVDAANRQVPYIFHLLHPALSNSSFIEFPVLLLHSDSVETTLELEIKNSKGTDFLSLIMANTSVERYTSLSGSADQKNWYIINDHILLHNSGENSDGSFVQSVRFPYVKYKYLKLVIKNGHSDPLNILRTGVYESSPIQRDPVYISNPTPAYRQVDSSNGHSYVFTSNRAPYFIDRISLQVNGPKFFKRAVDVYEKGKALNYISSFTLSSDSTQFFQIPVTKAVDLVLDIENKDNPPLQIKSVTTGQVQRYLTALLESGKAYFLLADNSKAIAPVYDLPQFEDRLPEHIDSIGYGNLVSQELTSPSLLNSRYWLWLILVSGISALAYFTYKLSNEVKRSA